MSTPRSQPPARLAAVAPPASARVRTEPDDKVIVAESAPNAAPDDDEDVSHIPSVPPPPEPANISVDGLLVGLEPRLFDAPPSVPSSRSGAATPRPSAQIRLRELAAKPVAREHPMDATQLSQLRQAERRPWLGLAIGVVVAIVCGVAGVGWYLRAQEELPLADPPLALAPTPAAAPSPIASSAPAPIAPSVVVAPAPSVARPRTPVKSAAAGGTQSAPVKSTGSIAMDRDLD